MRLESYCVVSNRTGIPFQLMQWQANTARQTFDDNAGGCTVLSDCKEGLPKRKAETPLQPGLKAAIQDPSIDWTSCLDLPAGGSSYPELRADKTAFSVSNVMLHVLDIINLQGLVLWKFFQLIIGERALTCPMQVLMDAQSSGACSQRAELCA